jgi:hypothetical protein
VAIRFPDVEPEVLAREAASDPGRVGRPTAGDWQAYLRRVLPVAERDTAGDMARAMLTTGGSRLASRAHAEWMRRQALAAGLAHRVRFWTDVANEISRF